MSDASYRDKHITCWDDDDSEYEAYPIEVDGKDFKLIDFNVCKSEDGTPMLAVKVRSDKNLILYYLLEGGKGCLECLKEMASKNYPDYRLRDVVFYMSHYLDLNDDFSKSEVELKEHV